MTNTIDLTPPPDSKVDITELKHPHREGFRLQLHQLLATRPYVESVVLTDAADDQVRIAVRFLTQREKVGVVNSVESGIAWMRDALDLAG